MHEKIIQSKRISFRRSSTKIDIAVRDINNTIALLRVLIIVTEENMCINIKHQTVLLFLSRRYLSENFISSQRWLVFEWSSSRSTNLLHVDESCACDSSTPPPFRFSSLRACTHTVSSSHTTRTCIHRRRHFSYLS